MLVNVNFDKCYERLQLIRKQEPHLSRSNICNDHFASVIRTHVDVISGSYSLGGSRGSPRHLRGCENSGAGSFGVGHNGMGATFTSTLEIPSSSPSRSDWGSPSSFSSLSGEYLNLHCYKVVVIHNQQSHVPYCDMIKNGKYTLIKAESVSKACLPIDFPKFGPWDLF